MGVDRYYSLAYPHKYSRRFSAKVRTKIFSNFVLFRFCSKKKTKQSYPCFYTQGRVEIIVWRLLNNCWKSVAKKSRNIKQSGIISIFLFDTDTIAKKLGCGQFLIPLLLFPLRKYRPLLPLLYILPLTKLRLRIRHSFCINFRICRRFWDLTYYQ